MRDTFRLRNAPVYGIILVILFSLGIVFLPADIVGKVFSSDELISRLSGITAIRLIGAAFLIFLSADVGFGLFRFSRKLPFALPLFAVAVNNLPIIALATGAAEVTRAQLIPLLLAECMAVAMFEEFAFRGLVFPFALKAFGSRRHAPFMAVITSGCLFGLLHLVNIPSAGAAALLQVGYSALIGAACAVIVLYTANIIPAVLLHGIYNFCGYLVPELGAGTLWDAPTVAVTAVIAVAAAVWAVFLLKTCAPINVSLILGDDSLPVPSDRRDS